MVCIIYGGYHLQGAGLESLGHWVSGVFDSVFCGLDFSCACLGAKMLPRIGEQPGQ